MRTFYEYIISEMPMNLNFVGGWEPIKGEPQLEKPFKKYGFKQDDISLLRNPKGLEKIKAKWSKVEQNFNTWICRSSNCFKVREVGEVNNDYIRDVLKLKIVPAPKNTDEINIDPESINYIVTNNMGAERIVLNSWTLAHRFGHVLASGKRNESYKYYLNEFWRDIKQVVNGLYNLDLKLSIGLNGGYYISDTNTTNFLKSFFQEIGTMRSARNKTLRNPYEFLHELFAQYIISGKVTFNTPPKSIRFWKRQEPSYNNTRTRGYMTYASSRLSQSEFEEYSEYLKDHVAEMCTTNIDQTLSQCVGKIFVM